VHEDVVFRSLRTSRSKITFSPVVRDRPRTPSAVRIPELQRHGFFITEPATTARPWPLGLVHLVAIRVASCLASMRAPFSCSTVCTFWRSRQVMRCQQLLGFASSALCRSSISRFDSPRSAGRCPIDPQRVAVQLPRRSICPRGALVGLGQLRIHRQAQLFQVVEPILRIVGSPHWPRQLRQTLLAIAAASTAALRVLPRRRTACQHGNEPSVAAARSGMT